MFPDVVPGLGFYGTVKEKKTSKESKTGFKLANGLQLMTCSYAAVLRQLCRCFAAELPGFTLMGRL